MKDHTGQNLWGLLNIACDLGFTHERMYMHIVLLRCSHGKYYKRYRCTRDTLGKAARSCQPFRAWRCSPRASVRALRSSIGQDQRRWRRESCLAASIHVLPKNTDPVAAREKYSMPHRFLWYTILYCGYMLLLSQPPQFTYALMARYCSSNNVSVNYIHKLNPQVYGSILSIKYNPKVVSSRVGSEQTP